jgi:hypothetical protein
MRGSSVFAALLLLLIACVQNVHASASLSKPPSSKPPSTPPPPSPGPTPSSDVCGAEGDDCSGAGDCCEGLKCESAETIEAGSDGSSGVCIAPPEQGTVATSVDKPPTTTPTEPTTPSDPEPTTPAEPTTPSEPEPTTPAEPTTPSDPEPTTPSEPAPTAPSDPTTPPEPAPTPSSPTAPPTADYEEEGDGPTTEPTSTPSAPASPAVPDDAGCLTPLQAAQGNPDLSTLVKLIEAAGLADVVGSATDAYTIFAPTNAAIEALGNETLAALGEDKEALTKVCLYMLFEN